MPMPNPITNRLPPPSTPPQYAGERIQEEERYDDDRRHHQQQRKDDDKEDDEIPISKWQRRNRRKMGGAIRDVGIGFGGAGVGLRGGGLGRSVASGFMLLLVCSCAMHGRILLRLPHNDHEDSAKDTATATANLRRLYGDETIDPQTERDRCARYGWAVDEYLLSRGERRRLYLGGLIADDSWQPIEAVAYETYGIYTAIAFVESNTTQSYFNRTLRFYRDDNDNGKRASSSSASSQTDNWAKLAGGMFGPDTDVTVDLYVDNSNPDDNPQIPLVREHMQRAYINKRWARAGMTPRDVGVVSDADETFTRDFLRAAQICDIPVFRPGQTCRKPKLVAAAMVFESAPDCIVRERLWFHPDMMIGECIELVGNGTAHPPAKRMFRGIHGKRVGGGGSESEHDNATGMYPLHDAGDFRNYPSGSQPRLLRVGVEKPPSPNSSSAETVAVEAAPTPHGQNEYKWDDDDIRRTGQPIQYTAYHFHNFFESTFDLRRKYRTYGHPLHDAYVRPLANFHEDLNLTVRCVLNLTDEGNVDAMVTPIRRVVGGLDAVIGPKPLYFDVAYRRRRWDELKNMLENETNLL